MDQLNQIISQLPRDPNGNFIIPPDVLSRLFAMASTMDEQSENEPSDYHAQVAQEMERTGAGNTPVRHDMPTTGNGGLVVETQQGRSRPVAANPRRSSIKEIFDEERASTAQRNAARGKR